MGDIFADFMTGDRAKIMGTAQFALEAFIIKLEFDGSSVRMYGLPSLATILSYSQLTHAINQHNPELNN